MLFSKFKLFGLLAALAIPFTAHTSVAAISQSQDDSTKTIVAQQTTEPFHSGMRQGIMYSVYIHEKQDLGGNRWRFRTRAEYSRGKDYYSPWRTADCNKSSIDGKIIPAIARYGAEEGGASLIRAICGLSD